jgi:hypothetical protein|tara:strand:- start:87 stop:380 length:294 start_codon:yes stop_codon:yes gene_type:complete
MDDQEKKPRVELGIAIPVTNKPQPSSYDLKGNIKVEGKMYRFGAYMSEASGNGKMASGAKYYYFHRVELLDETASTEAASAKADTSFKPADLEKELM